MKRFSQKLTVVTAVILLICSLCVFAEDEPKTITNEQLNVIKLLEIANGDQNGNMNYEASVTRAEFVKMVVNASVNKDTASNTKLNISLFPDVRNTHWASSYVSVAINNGLVNGYLDGTFKPSNPVTLEEAATIVLRLLGYNNNDFVGNYPQAQLNKYESLELDNNITAQRGDKLTREECMILLYNMLSTKTKGGAAYCTMLGLSSNSEGKLDYSALLEDKLDGPYIVSESGITFNEKEFIADEKTQYVLNNKSSSLLEIKENDVYYTSDVINTVFVYRKTATGIVNATSSSSSGHLTSSSTTSISSNSSTNVLPNSGMNVSSSQNSYSSTTAVSTQNSQLINGSVNLSGKSYRIATTTAESKLSFGGKFYGENVFVTLILGMNDCVVDVIEGDISNIQNNTNNSSLLSMIDSTISSAILLENDDDANNWYSKIPFSTNTAKYYFNGALTKSVDIKVNDVIYYSKPFNSIWVFRKTKSGTIENITTRTSPSAVTVSGKTYNIASSSAAYDFSIYGSYDVGDNVTLILGLNDECVAVKNSELASSALYGVVTAVGEKIYYEQDGTEYLADYITVTDSAANSHTYEYRANKFKIGDVVSVYVSAKVSISVLPEIGRSDALVIANAINNMLYNPNCEIIDVKDSSVIKVSPSRLKGVQIENDLLAVTSHILFCEFDENGLITKLILNNFTGDLDEYGVVLSSSNGNVIYKTSNIDKNFTAEGTSSATGVSKIIKRNGNPVGFSPLNGCIEELSVLTTQEAFDKNGTSFPVASNVKVFIRNAQSYTYVSIDDIDTDNYNIKAYYDKLPKFGGRIRVLIAIRKV